MKGIILAAGRGSRMGDLTQQKPKCLVELAGKPLLEYQIDALNKAAITDVGIVCGYKKEKITDARLSYKFENRAWEQTNMVRSLMCADDWLHHHTCVVSYSDIFYHASAVRLLAECEADIAITYDPNFKKLWSARFENPLADLETFRIDDQAYLQDIGNRSQTLEEIQGQYMGLLKFTPTGWRHVLSVLKQCSELELNKLDMTSLLKRLLNSNVPIKAVAYEGVWGEVDNSEDLKLYEQWNMHESVLA